MESQTREQQDSSWGKRLVRVASVRLGDGSRGVFEVPRGVFTPGATVTLGGPSTPGTGVILTHAGMVLDPPRVDGTVTGLATDADVNREAKVRAREHVVTRIGRAVIRDLDLPAKVVCARAEDGGNRFSLIICTEDRIDFRVVLRTLGQRTRERVELRIVGDRDAAKIIGGVGPCGLQLCCNTFLENFAPVGMRMAREQGLALHPERVNGVCGRLLCCLVYEDAAYRAARAAVPRLGDMRDVEGTLGEVIGVDTLAGTMRLRMPDGRELTMATTGLAPRETPPAT